jgi:outer membrane protein TolC
LSLLTVALAVGLVGCGTRAASAPDPVVTDARDAQVKVERFKKDVLAGQLATTAGAPLPQTDVSELANRTQLETLLRLAAEKSPMVSAAEHKWLAVTHKRGQVFTLPDPKLMFTYYARQMMPADRKWELGISQEIPYPGSLFVAAHIADREAQAAYLRYQGSVRDAIAEAKESFFELYYIDRAQGITGEVQKLYDRYAALAAGGTEVAKPKLPETFRAESQRAQLGYDLILLKEMREAEVAKLRAITGLLDQSVLGPTEEIAAPPPLATRLEEIQKIAEAHNQELAAAGVEVERAGLQRKLAHRAPIPSLMVGAGYMRTGDMPGGPDPTKDMVMLNFGVSVPIWFGKYKAMAREAAEMEGAAVSQQEGERLQLRANMAKAYFNLSNSSRLVQLYTQTLIPQARQALQSAEELYRKGEMNLSGLLETTATVHNFELARLRATADYYQNIARVERLLGTALELQPAKAEGPPKEEPKP